MDIIVIPFFKLIYSLLTFYYQLIFVSFILNLLDFFNLINTNNRFIRILKTITDRLTEPLLNKIRSILPLLGGIDFSPMILLLMVGYLRDIVTQVMLKVSF